MFFLFPTETFTKIPSRSFRMLRRSVSRDHDDGSDSGRSGTVDTAKLTLNPLSPQDALKHHFTSLKTDLIFLKPRDLKRKFP